MRTTRMLPARAVAPVLLLAIAALDGLALFWFASSGHPRAIEIAFLLSVTLVAPSVGVLIVRRQPRHPVGWLLVAHGCVTAPMLAGDGLSSYYAHTGQHVWAAAAEAQIS